MNRNSPLSPLCVTLLTTLVAATLAGPVPARAQAQATVPPVMNATATTATGTSTAAPCTLVEVQNVRPQRGLLMIAAYGDAGSFGKQSLLTLRVPAGEATTVVPLCGLTGAEVALTMFQDLDSDGRMGRNMVGLPTEPWGSSGSPGAFGPSWDTGRVPLDGKAIVVRLSQ